MTTVGRSRRCPRRRPAGIAMVALVVIGHAGCDRRRESRSIAPPDAWTLIEPAALVIGAGDTSRLSAFGRVAGALRLPNGSIVVSDHDPPELKLFDSTGRYVRTVGRTGGGPAEFRWPGPPQSLTGDSFFVVDVEQRRVSFFDRDARPVVTRRFSLQLADGRVLSPIGMVSSAQYVGKLTAWRHPRSLGERIRQPVDLVTGRFTGSEFDRIARGKGDETVGGEWHEAGHTSLMAYRLEFGSTTQIAVGRHRVYVGETADSRIEVFDFTGRQRGTISWDATPDPITEADRRARVVQESTLMAGIQSSDPAQLSSSVNHLRTVKLPKYAPTFTGLLPAGDGALWVEQDPRPWTPTRPYLVFDSAGVLVARAAIPRQLRPYQVAGDFVLGRWRVPGEADQVRLYRLSR